jgi:hypothetical protein
MRIDQIKWCGDNFNTILDGEHVSIFDFSSNPLNRKTLATRRTEAQSVIEGRIVTYTSITPYTQIQFHGRVLLH